MEEIVLVCMFIAIAGTLIEICAVMIPKPKKKRRAKKVKKLTRKDIVKLIAKVNYCSNFIAEDICDNLEQELNMFYDGWGFKPSVEVIIADYFALPSSWTVEAVVNAILN